MKLLVIDRDRDNCEQMGEFLTDSGIDATFEPIRSKGVDAFKGGGYDAIFFDPAPQGEARPFVIGIRRSTNSFPPIVFMTHDMTKEQVMAVGGNTMLSKPFDKNAMISVAKNAMRLTETMRMMADDKTDFPSKDGIIAKSAFNQLFIT
ncbi:MAG TPA: DNA-binding response regulator, partial [Alphaproteobacteria bacterium]